MNTALLCTLCASSRELYSSHSSFCMAIPHVRLAACCHAAAFRTTHTYTYAVTTRGIQERCILVLPSENDNTYVTKVGELYDYFVPISQKSCCSMYTLTLF